MADDKSKTKKPAVKKAAAKPAAKKAAPKKAAAIAGLGFHLWWHPHNFGSDFDANMGNLQKIVRHFLDLRERYGMRSMTMSDVFEARI